MGRAAPVGLRELFPNREETRRSVGPVAARHGDRLIARRAAGGGALLASFGRLRHREEISSRPEEFGQGAVEGVAAPEAANNAGAQTSFVPLLTLGVRRMRSWRSWRAP